MHWPQISQHICTSAISLCADGLVTQDEFRRRANAHLLEITTLLVLLLLVLLTDLILALVLQCLVARSRSHATKVEIAEARSLVHGDDD